MLLNVEGGGFFSASASGYTKGLGLLLLGKKNEERSMKVSPWSQLQTVEQELNHNKQLAPSTEPCSKCASLACFCYPSTTPPAIIPPTMAKMNQSEAAVDPSIVGERPANLTATDDFKDADNKDIKSSLKKPPVSCSSSEDFRETQVEAERSVTVSAGVRRVQWSDACGRELIEIREFEMSDEEMSEEEFSHACNKRCGCAIQ